MNKYDYEFLSAYMDWFNENYGFSYGKFSWIDSVSVIPSGCGEGTCQWEDVVIDGDDINGRYKQVRMDSTSLFPFFKVMSK